MAFHVNKSVDKEAVEICILKYSLYVQLCFHNKNDEEVC